MFPWQKSILHYARALGASRLKNLESAKAEIDTLELLREELLKKKSDYYANQVMIEIKSAQAWWQLSNGNETLAVALMQEASDMESNTEKHGVTPGEVLPARELLGDMLLHLNRPEMALAAYEKNLIDRPNRFNGIYGAAVASEELGDTEKTSKYFQMLLDFTDGSDSDRPEIIEAKRYLESQKS